MRDAASTSELIQKNNVDAIEIHTSGRNTSRFKALWLGLGESAGRLKLVAVSMVENMTLLLVLLIFWCLFICIEKLKILYNLIVFLWFQVSLPDMGDSTVSSMEEIYSIMKPRLHCINLWQVCSSLLEQSNISSFDSVWWQRTSSIPCLPHTKRHLIPFMVNLLAKQRQVSIFGTCVTIFSVSFNRRIAGKLWQLLKAESPRRLTFPFVFFIMILPLSWSWMVDLWAGILDVVPHASRSCLLSV